MTKPELYRHVFRSSEGQLVLADLARHVETMGYEKPGSAVVVIAYILRMMNTPDPPANGRRGELAPKQSGGRIEHG
jgi:hypothetical protein